MSTYDFDGVDLDWEYPVAEDRSGRDEDFKNFPKFLANLKKALKSTGGRDEVTLTLPASMCKRFEYSSRLLDVDSILTMRRIGYLKHFDIVNLEKHVDFFNMYVSLHRHGFIPFLLVVGMPANDNSA